MPLSLLFPDFIPWNYSNQHSGVKSSVLLTQIHVWTHSNSDVKLSKDVSFKGTKSKIYPDEAIQYVKETLEKSYIPAAIWLVPDIQMICNIKQPLKSK